MGVSVHRLLTYLREWFSYVALSCQRMLKLRVPGDGNKPPGVTRPEEGKPKESWRGP